MEFRLPDGTSAVVVERKDSLSWALMPELLRRVTEFCAKYDSEANVNEVRESIIRAFVQPTPGTIGMLHVKSGIATGHLLCNVGDWMGARIVTILQLELGDQLVPDLADAVLAWVDKWAEANGAKFIHCLARSEATARLFRARYGFDREFVSMRKPVTAQVRAEGVELVNT